MLENMVNKSVEIWLIKSRISDRIVDSATTYMNAKQRADVMNRVYQTDEYVVQKYRDIDGEPSTTTVVV